MKKPTPKPKKNKIPSIPFSLEDVYLLSHYEASEELQNRLKVWKAGRDYIFIKSLSDLIIKDYSSHNRKLSRQEKLHRNQYIEWLSIGLESDKFRSLSAIRLKDSNTSTNLALRNDYHNEDMLTHSGIL